MRSPPRSHHEDPRLGDRERRRIARELDALPKTAAFAVTRQRLEAQLQRDTEQRERDARRRRW